MEAPAATDIASYHVFGLHVRSTVPLPGVLPLQADDTSLSPDVEIGFGTTPTIADAPDGYRVTKDGTLLSVPVVGRYWITNGARIVVDPLPSASERNVRLFLLGSALGAILHQRGLVPLHANAVEVNGRAVAFMGHSGAGKSTLAAWFLDRGHAVLTDDVCVVEHDAPGGPVAHRGLVRLRLWREAMARSGREATEADRSFDGQDKFDVVMTQGRHAPATLPFGAAVLLERTDVGDTTITRLRGVEAVAAMMENIYRGGHAQLSGNQNILLKACADLAQRVPVLKIRRIWGFDRFDDEASGIEASLRAMLAD